MHAPAHLLYPVALLSLMLTACQSERHPPQAGSAPRALDLDQQVAASSVEPDQWAALKLDLTPWMQVGETLHLGLSISPAASAQPFLAFMVRLTLPNGLSSPVTPIFLALPEGETVGVRIDVSNDGDEEDNEGLNPQLELGLVLGSRVASSKFRLGLIDSALEDDAIVDALAERPGVDIRIASGHGGAAGSYLRLVDDEGQIQTVQTGLMHSQDTVLAVLPDGLSLLHQTSLQAGDRVDEPVIASATLLGQPQTGLSDWDYAINLPPHQLADQGQFLAIAGAPPPVAVSTLGFAPMAFYVLANSDAGELDLRSRYRYSGQEHSSLLDEVSVADGGLVFTWGYVPRAALQAFGWEISEILPGQ